MSLPFQNADTIKQALIGELQNILSADDSIRTSAENKIKQLEFTEGYGIYLAEFTMNQSLDLHLRQMACSLLTRFVEQHWEEAQEAENFVASEVVKKTIRNILPNGLYDQNSKIRSAVARTISGIANFDWPTVWTELFDIIIKCLGGNEDSIHGAMQVLVEFTYDDKQIKELGPIILSEVYRIFDAEQTYSVKTRTYAIKILKPLLQSIAYSIQNKQEKTAMMNSVLSNLVEKLVRGLSTSSGQSFNAALKTEIVKILAYLTTEMPKYIHPYMNGILPTIWQLLTQSADIYVKVIVYETQPDPFPGGNEEDDEMSNLTTMIIQIFEFIIHVIGCEKFHPIIQNVLTDLIYIMIVYIQVTEEQIEVWNNDPVKFNEDEDDHGVDLTVRLSGTDVLSSLCEEFEAAALQPLSDALARHISVAEAEKAAGNAHWWKIYDASMVAVCTFDELIMKNEEKFDLSNYLTLVKNLTNFPPTPYLLGRCLCTLSTFSKSKLYSVQMLNEIFDITLDSLSRDKPMILKMCAVRAIYGFVTNFHKASEDRRHLILSKMAGFVDGIIPLIEQTDSSMPVLFLETLTIIISFDNNFAATIHDKVIPITIATLLRHPDDPFLVELIQDMLRALSQNPLCLQPLQDKMLPILINILNVVDEKPDATMQEIALYALETLVKYSQAPLSDNFIQNAFPAVVHCILKTDDHSVMSSGGDCLRAFIFVSPEQVCAYKNGEGLNYIMQVTTMLLSPMNNEITATQVGRLVITIITKMGNLLGENVDLILKAVISKMQLVESLRVMMSLVIPFAYLCLTQMDAVLNFLSTVPGPTGEPAMQFVFTNWLIRQQNFFSSYESKVTIMSLCKLFEYGVTTEDTRLTSVTIKELKTDETTREVRTRSQAAGTQQWVNIPVLLKMFKLLVAEVSSLKEIKQAAEDEDSSWTDDEDDENAGGEKVNTSKHIVTLQDILNNDEDDEDDDQLLQELLKNPIFQVDMEEHLTKFLKDFSNSKHFPAFASELKDAEKAILRSIDIKVQ